MNNMYDILAKLNSVQSKQQLNESKIEEKIEPPIKTDPAERGKYKGKSVEELKKMKADHLKHTANQREAGKPVSQADKEKTAELNFAIRAKQAHGGKWGKIKESEDSVMESTLDMILQRHSRDFEAFKQGHDLSDELYYALYDYYYDDMPYGTKKARTGDPYEWIAQRLDQDLNLDEGNRYGYNVTMAKQKGLKKADLDGDGDMETVKEVGDTPAGKQALAKVRDRAHGTMDQWSANPKSGYSATPKAVNKATSAAVAAGNRLHGFGPDKMSTNTVMARDALRKKLGMHEEGGTPMTPKQKSFAKLAPPKDKITFADKIAGAKATDESVFRNPRQIPRAPEVKKSDIPAMMRKSRSGGSDDWMVSAADLQADKEKTWSSPEGLAKRKSDLGIVESIKVGDQTINVYQDIKYDEYHVRVFDKGQEVVERRYFTESRDDALAVAKVMCEGWEDMIKAVKARSSEPRVGDVRRGHKHDIEYTPTGMKVTRRTDPEGYSVGADDETDGEPVKRGRGRPKGTGKSIGAKGPSGKSKLLKRESELEEDRDLEVDAGEFGREGDMAKEQMHTIEAAAEELSSILSDEQDLPEWVQKKITLAMDYIDTARDYMKSQGHDEEIAERKLSSSEKEEREDIVKGMKKNKGDFEKRYGKRGEEVMYATATKLAKERGPGNPDRKKKEEVEETTVAGAVATSAEPAKDPGAPKASKAKGGLQFGKGVYENKLAESFDNKLNQVLNEGVSVNMSSDQDGKTSLTVTATDEDALKLSQILNLAGLGGSGEYKEACPSCGSSDCGCEQVEEDLANSADNTEYADTDYMVNDLSGGLNGRKSTGQTTIPVIASQLNRQVSMESNDVIELYKRIV